MKLLRPILLILLYGCSTANIDNSDIDVSNEKLNSGQTEKDLDLFRFDTTLTQSLSEFPLSLEEKKILIAEIESQYDYYIQSEYAISKKPLLDNFTFIELNADGKPDLLFQGWSGGEPECISIHFSSGNKLDSAVTFYQFLKDIKIENGRIKFLTTVDPGCCSDYVEQELTYEFDQELKSKLIGQRVRIRAESFECRILNSPIQFTVENASYKLRGEPMVNDTNTLNYDYIDQGNTIAVFNEGSKGQAWAINSSDTERDWWYVEMEPTVDSLEFDMFNYIDNKQSLRRVGWMSSRFLKVIE